MEKIYSKVKPDKLLHIINRFSDIDGRTDIVPKENFLQCASLNMNKGDTFKPHKHVWKDGKDKVIAQESWVVIKGKVKCIFYDIDNTILETPILNQGDASFTLFGGHTYETLENDTIVYEYKTGPYEGQKLDKEFLDD
tara:strand:- start:885 stop:1298 length:414 start_codon:yes stop_codon:yes gene_type:complete